MAAAWIRRASYGSDDSKIPGSSGGRISWVFTTSLYLKEEDRPRRVRSRSLKTRQKPRTGYAESRDRPHQQQRADKIRIHAHQYPDGDAFESLSLLAVDE